MVVPLSLGGEDVDEVWRDHVRDDDTLVTYAKAMRSLATGPWKEKDNYDRICWCAQACSEYLEHRLEELLLKDHRRQTHGVPTVVHPSLLPSSSSVRALVDDLRRLPLRLLDVGSCYNPFLSLPRFSVTAIDIAPASEVSVGLSLSLEFVSDCLEVRLPECGCGGK